MTMFIREYFAVHLPANFKTLNKFILIFPLKMQKKNSLAKRTDKNVIISNMAWSTNIPSNKVISIAAPADREAD